MRPLLSISKFLLLLTGLYIGICLTACHTDFEDIYHTVIAVEQDNTLLLKGGVKVKLIGITDNDQTRQYLEQHVLNKRVKVVFDKSAYPEEIENTRLVYAYINTILGEPINKQMLKGRLCDLDETHLSDSLAVYKQFAKTATAKSAPASPAPPVPAPSPGNKRDEIQPNRKLESLKPIHKAYSPTPRPGPKARFIDMVAYTKQCVFLVIRMNDKGDITGTGSGFFVNEKGYGVSCQHVFEGASRWIIRTADGRQYPVERILREDATQDYILFSLGGTKGETFPYLNLAETAPQEGEDIFVMGNPKGLESVTTRGIVSALRYTDNKHIIQIDAAISPGSSGSPLLNMEGQAVGIITSKVIGCENCNFAIDIKTIGEIQ